MIDPKDQAFFIASVMANRKEAALRVAIDYWFAGKPWDENTLEQIAGVRIDADGTETFYIGDDDLIEFSPLQTKIDIEGERVMCLYSQPFKGLFE